MELSEFFSSAVVVWFFIGLVLLLLEFAVPGLIIMFFGVGAWITALCCLFFDIGINAQLIIFITSSVLSLAFLRKYFKKIFVGKDEEAVDETLEEFLGKIVIAETDIPKNDSGKVIFKGSRWEAVSDFDIAKGDKVKIISRESIILKVEPINKVQGE